MKIATIAFILMCGLLEVAAADLSDRTMQYQIQDNRYGVIVAEDGISEAQAQQMAMKKAAEVAVDNGYRYFVIDSESEVTILKSDQGFPAADSAPKNIYYELIQSNNFGRERMDQLEPSMENLYAGWRIQFSCYKIKPSSGQVIDACQFANCH